MTDLELVISGRSGSARLTLIRSGRERIAAVRDLLSLSARLEEDSGLVALTGVETLEGDGLAEWFTGLAERWRGWSGELTWGSLEDDLFMAASHDGSGHVRLRLTLRGPFGYLADVWEASACVWIDAGEDLTRLAADVRAFFADDDSS